MLSYQHAYHAGNPADLLKHALWAEVLTALVHKPKPLHIYETHAGRGIYPLIAAETEKGAEWQQGLGALKLGTLAGAYGKIVRGLNAGGKLEVIPGSPAVGAALLRPTDALHLAELHPAERVKLHSWARSSRLRGNDAVSIHIHDADGWVQIPPLVKAGQRDVILIDPSYEQLTEYQQVINTLQTLIKRNPKACVVVWLPMLAGGKGKGQHQPVLDAAKAMGVPATYLAQWHWREKFAPLALQGTAMLVLNLPFGLEKTLPATLETYAQQLTIKRHLQTYTWLVPRA